MPCGNPSGTRPGCRPAPAAGAYDWTFSSWSLRSCFVALPALKIRTDPPAPTNRRRLTEYPMMISRCSPMGWSSSSKIRANGSAMTVRASSKDTPCLVTAVPAFLASHLTFRSHLRPYGTTVERANDSGAQTQPAFGRRLQRRVRGQIGHVVWFRFSLQPCELSPSADVPLQSQLVLQASWRFALDAKRAHLRGGQVPTQPIWQCSGGIERGGGTRPDTRRI